MTDCNAEPLHFSTLGPKAVVADFQGGRLTTDAGALLLREVDAAIGLFDALDAAIPDPRNPVFIIHDQRARVCPPNLGVHAARPQKRSHCSVWRQQIKAAMERAPRAFRRRPSVLAAPSTTPLPIASPEASRPA